LSCQDCLAGEYSEKRWDCCKKCGRGKVSDAKASYCTTCLAGYYADHSKNTCTLCAANTYSAAAADICTLCAAGSYSGLGESRCHSCCSGQYFDPIKFKCVNCMASYYTPNAGQECKKCPCKMHSAEKESMCHECPPGTTINASQTGCDQTDKCSEGYTFENGKCVCKAGSYITGGKCVECGDRQYSTYDDSTECQTCYFGRVFQGHTVCAHVECFGGYTMDRDSNCICQAGYYETTMNFCLECGEGQYSPFVNSTRCTMLWRFCQFRTYNMSLHRLRARIHCGQGQKLHLQGRLLYCGKLEVSDVW
jgi:hypothetical protein